MTTEDPDFSQHYSHAKLKKANITASLNNIKNDHSVVKAFRFDRKTTPLRDILIQLN